MLTKELLKQVKQIEILTKGMVNDVFSGEYHSVFKGRGMEFSEVREYQPGDDIRTIDWNVTARLGHPFVKIFEEERELTVMLLIDMSGSLDFGSIEKTKRQIAAELSAILAFSALKNNDKVGLILFTDRIEKFVAPKKGRSHALRIVRDILSFDITERKTDIKSVLEYFNHTIKKKAIVFLLSDFMDKGYEKIIRIIGKKHDLIAVRLRDEREFLIPEGGLLKLKDNETGEIRYLDSSNPGLKEYLRKKLQAIDTDQKRLFVSSRIDSIDINTGHSYIKPLVDFFKLREKRW